MKIPDLPALTAPWDQLPRFATPHSLDCARLLLRPWLARDLPRFAELNGDAHNLRHFPAPLSQADSNQLAYRIHGRLQELGWGLWAVEIKATADAAARFAGFTGLAMPRSGLPVPPCLELGWRLHPDCQGQGYAREAARAARDFGFQVLGQTELISFTGEQNLASRRVMEAIGMQDSGERFTHPAFAADDARAQHCLYTLTLAQWQALRAQEAALQAD